MGAWHEHEQEQAPAHEHGEGAGAHPYESRPHQVDEAQEEATEEHRRTVGEAREPYGGTADTDPDEAWERATDA